MSAPIFKDFDKAPSGNLILFSNLQQVRIEYSVNIFIIFSML